MKWLIRGILVVLIFLLIMPSIIVHFSYKEPDIASNSEDNSDIEIQMDKVSAVENIKVSDITMYNHRTKELVKMPLEEYLIGVVAGEMPASYEMEALKAQAVAARTFVVSKLSAYGGNGCSSKEGADVCSYYGHCQEWISEETMKENWASYFDSNYKKIKNAVEETKGEIMTYKDKPIEVFYYSTSNGKTEDAGEVFSHSLPYYEVVDSVGEEEYPKFLDSITYKNEKFTEIFNSKYNTNLTVDNLENKIKINDYTESGRVKSITVGSLKLRATDFRLLFGLNSTDFTIHFSSDSITFNTKGYGHGVGMSQVGADCMAKRDYTYKDILLHYYKGVEIKTY